MCPADSTASPPVIAGHYRIIDLVGEGGFSWVYRALDLNLQREVALKRLRPDRFPQPDSVHRLMREARAVSRLSNPGIVTVFDAFVHEGTAWIVMELVDGATLREVLKLRGSLGVEEILDYAEQITSALGAAHSAGILHRDITPRNVLIGRDGRARLTDFGLACGYISETVNSRAPTASTNSAMGGKVVGTRGYMSPEQLLARPVDPRSDLFSLGLLFYEMCTGRPAFSPTSGGDLYDAVLHHEPVAIGRLNYEIPGELDRIVQKAIAKRPDERYQSAADLLADVRRLRRSVESESASLELKDRRQERRTFFKLKIAVSAAALIGLAAGAYEVWNWIRQPRIPTAVPHQLTSTPGWETRPALSPTGDLVAFASDRSGNSDIWVIDAAGSGDPLRLTDDPALDDDPAWYPDGRSLAFASYRDGRESIWKVPRLRGAAALVLPDALDPAISPDGKRIAFVRKGKAGSYRVGVARLNSPGDAVILTGDRDGDWNHRHPAWSPDGKRLVYADFQSLWVVPAAGGRARRLTAAHSRDFDPVWSAGGRFIYFSSLRGGTLAIWRVSPEGGTAERMTLGTGPESQPSVSRDGSRLAYSTYAGNSDVALMDLATGARRTLPGDRREDESAFAPDGSALLFVSDRLGTTDLWLQPLAGGGPTGAPRRFTELPGSIARPGFSPDGAWVSFHRAVKGKRDIWIMPSGGGPPLRFTDDPAQDFQPSWSPLGSEIVFISNRDGQDHVWVAPVSGGRPAGPARRLSEGPGSDMLPVWSPDARSIAFLRHTGLGADIWVVPASGSGAPRRLTEGADAHYLAVDDVDGTLFVSGTWGTGRTEIRRVDPRSGRVIPWDPPLLCGGEPAICAVSVSRDGGTLAFMIDKARGDLWMLRAAPESY